MLNKQIRETIQEFRDSFPPEITTLIEQGAGEISALDIIESARKMGDTIPDAPLKGEGGETIHLSEYLKDGPLVLTFYRGLWCPYCNLQLKAYSERLDEIKALGANLVAVTPEKPGATDILVASGAQEELINTAVKDVSFDVLHDAQNKLAEAFGLVFNLPESHRKLLEMMKVDVEALNGDASYTFPDPATYVICPDGEIAWSFVPNNYRKRAEVEDILGALRSLKSVN
ncbi:MAG: peroxiredoxin-like family protein [Kordiimonas sp.]